MPIHVHESIYLAERFMGGWLKRSRHGRWALARIYWTGGAAAKGHMAPYTCLARIGCLRVTCDLPPPQIAGKHENTRRIEMLLGWMLKRRHAKLFY